MKQVSNPTWLAVALVTAVIAPFPAAAAESWLTGNEIPDSRSGRLLGLLRVPEASPPAARTGQRPAPVPYPAHPVQSTTTQPFPSRGPTRQVAPRGDSRPARQGLLPAAADRTGLARRPAPVVSGATRGGQSLQPSPSSAAPVVTGSWRTLPPGASRTGIRDGEPTPAHREPRDAYAASDVPLVVDVAAAERTAVRSPVVSRGVPTSSTLAEMRWDDAEPAEQLAWDAFSDDLEMEPGLGRDQAVAQAVPAGDAEPRLLPAPARPTPESVPSPGAADATLDGGTGHAAANAQPIPPNTAWGQSYGNGYGPNYGQNYGYTLSSLLKDDGRKYEEQMREQQFCQQMWACAGGRCLSWHERMRRKWQRNYDVIWRGPCGDDCCGPAPLLSFLLQPVAIPCEGFLGLGGGCGLCGGSCTGGCTSGGCSASGFWSGFCGCSTCAAPSGASAVSGTTVSGTSTGASGCGCGPATSSSAPLFGAPRNAAPAQGCPTGNCGS